MYARRRMKKCMGSICKRACGCVLSRRRRDQDRCLVSGLLLEFPVLSNHGHPGLGTVQGSSSLCDFYITDSFLTGAGETLDMKVGLLYSYHFAFANFPTSLAPDWPRAPLTACWVLAISWWRHKKNIYWTQLWSANTHIKTQFWKLCWLLPFPVPLRFSFPLSQSTFAVLNLWQSSKLHRPFICNWC